MAFLTFRIESLDGEEFELAQNADEVLLYEHGITWRSRVLQYL